MVARSKLEIVVLLCCLKTAEQYLIDNLSLNKNAYHDNVLDGGGAGLAVDGDLRQSQFAGSCSHTSTIHANASWKVDLGKIYIIDHVKIYNRADCCSNRLRDVELYIGSERQTYTKYGFKEGHVGSIYTFQLENAVRGQWVLITRSPSVVEHLTLCEVQVMGSDTEQYFDIEPNWIKSGDQTTVTALTDLQCAYHCHNTRLCLGANFNRDEHTCSILTSITNADTANDSMFIST